MMYGEKSTPLTLRKELKKMTVCKATMNVTEIFTCEKAY